MGGGGGSGGGGGGGEEATGQRMGTGVSVRVCVIQQKEQVSHIQVYV